MSDPLPSKSHQADPRVPALPEVEFALVLQRIINSAKDDPAALRQNVYELARMKLRKEAFNSNPQEAAHLARALETAIVGVETFHQHSNRAADFSPQVYTPTLLVQDEPLLVTAASPMRPQPLRFTSTMIEHPPRPQIEVDHQSTASFRKQLSTSGSYRFVIGTVVIVVVLCGALLQRVGFWEGIQNKIVANLLSQTSQPKSSVASLPENNSTKNAGTSSVSKAPPNNSSVVGKAVTEAPALNNANIHNVASPLDPVSDNTPTPTTYGTYAVANGQLIELELLSIGAPDRRVVISSTIKTPSRTVLPTGSPTFVVFRRDLASIPTEQIEVRAVAKITRTMKFNTNAKPPEYSSEDIWGIRNSSYKMKISPAPGNSEILLVRSDAPLPAGRYVLALKRQAYDFTIQGPINDPDQCFERIEATNGTFYSPCKTN